MTRTRECRRCLLEDMREERPLYRIVAERIRLLPEEQRVSAAEYKRRLAFCKACDQLMNGTCAQCGCYVEIRAARRSLRCAHPIPKW